MHRFYARGLLPVQFAIVETLEIGQLDYPALRIHFSGNVTNPTQHSLFAKPLRQQI